MTCDVCGEETLLTTCRACKLAEVRERVRRDQPPEQRMAADHEEYCGAQDAVGRTCTRPTHDAGAHVAHGILGEGVATWR